MPINIVKVSNKLKEKGEEFRRYIIESKEASQKMDSLFKEILGKEASAYQWQGSAIPLESPIDTIPLPDSLPSREEMARWAMQKLRGKVIISVDGSQIPPTKQLNFPIALVQAGYIVVPYDEREKYVCDHELEILTPYDILVEEDGVLKLSSQHVDYHRLKAELETAKMLVEKYNGKDIYLFLDTPLLFSWLKTAKSEMREAHIVLLEGFLDDIGEKAKVLGYIDDSSAKDISDMVQKTLSAKGGTISDKAVLYKYLPEFGMRSSVFLARRDILKYYRDYKDKIAFFYIRTGMDSISRVEFVLSEGIDFRVLQEVVAAQCIIGRGYPYALMRAHELAIIRMAEREEFYGIVRGYMRDNFGIEPKSSVKEERKLIPVV
jgi:hypothetical protein